MICVYCQVDNDAGREVCAGCAQKTTGVVLSDRYEILQTLGRGGMGIVYKAHDRKLDETVAIKLLRRDIDASGEASRRFRSEIRLARRVRHENVCGIHEYGEQGVLQYIVMEYIEGTDFKEILRRQGPLSPREACVVTSEVAEGLHAIHKAGVVHRDLKTPNLMRDSHGVVRLMDFGIAKEFNTDQTGGTASGMIVGTPEYMSPEQCMGTKLDHRSDIYALGIVFHELLTGVVPLRGDTPLATVMKHVSEQPRFDGAGLPPPVLPVLRKALAKSPDDRYASAHEMAVAIRDAATQVSDLPPATTALPRSVIQAAAVPDSDPNISTTAIPSTPTPRPAPVATPMETRVQSVASSTRVEAPRRRAVPAGIGWAAGGLVVAGAGAVAILLARGGRESPKEPAVAPSAAAPAPATATPDAEAVAALSKVKEFEAQLAELRKQQDQLRDDARRRDQPSPRTAGRGANGAGPKSSDELRSNLENETRKLEEQKREQERMLELKRLEEEARTTTLAASRRSSTTALTTETAAPTSAPPDPDRKAILDTLERYRAALEAKQLGAVKAVFPGAPEKAVRESFQFSKSIKVAIQQCAPQIEGAKAMVKCQRHDDIVTADNQTVANDSTVWFVLKKKDNDAWIIDVVR
jgi:serine/threonine-protein kinase